MEINKLIVKLGELRDKHNIKGIKIPRFGYSGCHMITDDEIKVCLEYNHIDKDGYLLLEGAFNYENPGSMHCLH